MPLLIESNFELNDIIIKGDVTGVISVASYPYGKLRANVELFQQIGGERKGFVELDLMTNPQIKTLHDQMLDLILDETQSQLEAIDPNAIIKRIPAP